MRPRGPLAAALATAGLLLWAGCDERRDGTLIAAAMSLRHGLLELGEAYEARHPRLPLRFHFASSGVLLQQAARGAPFDVVAFAGLQEMERLDAEGRIEPSTRVEFASNRLVVAVPVDGPRPSSLDDLVEAPYRRIAIGSPETVPAGRYAREALESAGLWGPLRPRLLFAGHVGQVVEYLERDEVDAGLIYASDAAALPWLPVAVEVDPSLHEPIRYPAAILREAPDREGARRFLDLLAGELGQVILRRHGFRPPTDRDGEARSRAAAADGPGGRPGPPS